MRQRRNSRPTNRGTGSVPRDRGRASARKVSKCSRTTRQSALSGGAKVDRGQGRAPRGSPPRHHTERPPGTPATPDSGTYVQYGLGCAWGAVSHGAAQCGLAVSQSRNAVARVREHRSCPPWVPSCRLPRSNEREFAGKRIGPCGAPSLAPASTVASSTFRASPLRLAGRNGPRARWR